MRQRFRWLPPLCALLLLGAGCRRSNEFAVLPLQAAPTLEVPQASGGVFRLSEQRGKVVVLTFGYTSCPDVCPTTLTQLQRLQSALGPASRDLQVVFLSVDPDRDGAEQLQTYVRAFSTRFTGLRLEPEGIAPVLAAWNVTAARHYPDTTRYREHPFAKDLPYTIDHTGAFFVVDKRGQLRLRLPYSVGGEYLRDEVARLLAEDEAPDSSPRVERARALLTPSRVGAIYLTLVNGTAQEDRLVSAESPSAGSVELHEVTSEGELMRMNPRPEGFRLPARSRVELEPGGKHLMLYAVPTRASRLDVTLRFEKAGPVTVSVPVSEPGADAL
ncbi:SCO family protein [Archangium primigenium]|uniref:SCO family protein n=1 Tax=[Archangium] primigenium TaxID=2792470 RepID=UPI00195B37E3|nr:SCO family protein [Archangium primigenium]MBM7116953.1 SCO family protein [Archangium primigenium]